MTLTATLDERGWPWWQQGDCLLVNADAREVREHLPADAAIVADPPYGMGWNTDSTRFSGGDNPGIRRGAGRDDWGDVAADDKPFDPTPWMAFPRAVLWGFNHFGSRVPVGTTLVWIKRSDDLFGTFLSDCELAWMKGGHGVYAFRKQFPPPLRIIEGLGKTAHPCQKPVELMAWCLQRAKVSAGESVCDPYMGSGTTGVACVRTGNPFIGCEIDPTHFATAVKRIGAELARTRLFAPTPPITQSKLFETP